jgi:uncharacterized membrane protein YbaN (DUF454 family)
MLKTLLWRGLTIIAICLAMLGVILPGLPATEFILLAAWSSAKGWPAVNFLVTKSQDLWSYDQAMENS